MLYKIVVDKQSRVNPSPDKRTYEINIEELRILGDVYDSLVITKDETYVMRKLALSEFHVLSVLPEPIKQPLTEVNIQLFEGDNYIYLIDMEGNRFYAEYLIKNEFNDLYVTQQILTAKIEESAGRIELNVQQKLDEELTGAKLILRINGNTSEAQINADQIKLLANDILTILANNEINLTTRNLTLKSNNFNVDKDGNMTCSNANITGGNIELSSSNSNLAKIKIYQTNDINEYTTISPIGFGTHYNGKTLISLNRTQLSGENDWKGSIYLRKENSNAYISLSQEALEFINNSGVVKTYVKETEIHTQDLYSTNLVVTGSKNRAVKINNGEYVLLNAYETATPYFGDIGSNKTDKNGYCKIDIEEIFSQTIELEDYKVFIQECGNGQLYVEKHDGYFEVKGTPNLEFDWELKAVQKGYKNTRLEIKEVIQNAKNDI